MPQATISCSGHDVPCYQAVPSGGGPWPGVVVLHDAMGMGTDLCRQADWLAEAGYLAIAPDLFAGGRKFICTVRAMRDIVRGEGRAWEEVEAARGWLEEHPQCTGRIGMIGFCFGGAFAILLASSGRYHAASVNYGMLPKDADRVLANACPIVASYGADDRHCPDHAARMEAILSKHGIAYDIREYEGTDHAFMNDHPIEEVPVLIKFISFAFSGGDYNEASTRDARRRITAFFGEHLGPIDSSQQRRSKA